MSRLTSNHVVGLMEAYNAVYSPQINEDYIWESCLTEEFISEAYQTVADYLVYNEFVPGYNTAEVYMSEMAVEDIDSILFETGVLDEEYLMEAGFFQGIGAGADRFVSGANKNIQGAASNVQRVGQTAVGSAQRLGTAAVGAVKTNIANKVKAVQGAAGEVQKRVTPVAQAVQGTAQRAVDAVKTDIGNKVKAGQAVVGGAQRAVDAAKTDIGNRVKAGQAVVGGVVNSANRRIGQEIEISRKVGAGEPLNKPTTAKPTPPASTGGMSAQNLAAYRSGGGNAAAQRGMGSSTAQVIAQGKKNLGRMDQGSGRSTLTQSFDPFDVVLGHLIDEGYADTEEAALQIMANMSEEWRESIVEGRVASETMGSGERRWERNDRYREENPTLPSGNPTGVNAQLMRQMAHAKKRGVKKKKN